MGKNLPHVLRNRVRSDSDLLHDFFSNEGYMLIFLTSLVKLGNPLKVLYSTAMLISGCQLKPFWYLPLLSSYTIS